MHVAGADGIRRAGSHQPALRQLFLSQILTQVGGNMVLYGLTIHVSNLTNSTTAVSLPRRSRSSCPRWCSARSRARFV
ncbi:MAG: hypothetical protein R3C32_10665 [Chloroflexota bacterium]